MVDMQINRIVEPTRDQAVFINAITLMEYAAVENFKTVISIRIGLDIWRTYFPNLADQTGLKWKTELHDIIPVELVNGHGIELVTFGP